MAGAMIENGHGPDQDFDMMNLDEPYEFRAFEFELVLPHAGCRHPQPRSGHRIVSDNLYIYSFGGFNPAVPAGDPHYHTDAIWASTKPLFQELWRFSKMTRTWTCLPINGDPPKELASHCMALWDDHTLLVYGGSGFPFGRTSSNTLYTCDLNTFVWEKVECTNVLIGGYPTLEDEIPLAGYGQAMTIDKERNCFYICGGTNGVDYNMDMHRFDWAEKKWTRLAFTPDNVEPRYRHEMALWEEKLYVIAGGTSRGNFATEMVPVFDLRTNKWSLERSKPFTDEEGYTEYPSPRYSHDCAQHGPDMFMVGGTNANSVLKDLWSLHLPTLTWTKYESETSKPLFFHSVSVSEEGELSVFGGVNSIRTKDRMNSVYSAWVRVPSLYTMATNAVLFGMRQKMIKGELKAIESKKPTSSPVKTQEEQKPDNSKAESNDEQEQYLSTKLIELYLSRNHISVNQFNMPVV